MAVNCAVPLFAKPCIENLGTEKLPCESARVMDWLNGPAGVVANKTLGELLVKVRVRLLGGVAPREIDWLSTWRSWPRLAGTFTVNAGAVTVAVMEVAVLPLGAVNPTGVVITKLVLPAVSGWKVVDAELVSPAKTTGLVTMVPTAVLELLTVMFALRPVRTF